MSVIWQGLLTGLCLSGTYALIAIGLSLFYRSAGVLNLAHGATVMITGMALTTLMTSLPNWFALPLGVAIGAAFAAVLFLVFMRPALHRGPWFMMFVTLGISFLAVGAAQVIWGTHSRAFAPLVSGRIELFGVVLRIQQVVGLGIAVVVTIAVTWLIRSTTLGRALRAAAEEPDGAATVGIDARRMMLIAALLSGALAGLSAALVVPGLGIEPQTANFFVLIAVTAAVLGGLGNVWGAIAGGLTLGIVNGLSTALAPRWFEVIEFSLLIAVLAYRSVIAGRTRRSRARRGRSRVGTAQSTETESNIYENAQAHG